MEECLHVYVWDIQGQFTIFNEVNEEALLNKFFEHILDVRPLVIVTYNGDSFDWMFVEERAKAHNIDMNKFVGWSKGREGYYLCRPCIHMDCLHWVRHDLKFPAMLILLSVSLKSSSE